MTNIAVSILIFLLVTGCSTTKQFKRRDLKKSSIELVKEGLGKVCLSGEGRGRFYSNGERQTFSFESFLNSDLDKLDISYHFPFHGEEGLSIFYREAMKDTIVYKGSLFDKLEENGSRKKERDLKEAFSPYMEKLGQFLVLLQLSKQKKNINQFIRCSKAIREEALIKGVCVYGPSSKSLSWETSKGHFSFLFDLTSGSGFLKVSFDREREKAFLKWTIAFVADGHGGIPLKIEKYITSCEV